MNSPRNISERQCLPNPQAANHRLDACKFHLISRTSSLCLPDNSDALPRARRTTARFATNFRMRLKNKKEASMKLAFTAAASAALLLSSVVAGSAADMAVKARPMAAPVAVWSWTGILRRCSMSAPVGAKPSPSLTGGVFAPPGGPATAVHTWPCRSRRPLRVVSWVVCRLAPTTRPVGPCSVSRVISAAPTSRAPAPACCFWLARPTPIGWPV